MHEDVFAVVLAAGRSTRMKSPLTKVLHPILGKPLLQYLLDALDQLGVPRSQTLLIGGENLPQLQAHFGHEYPSAFQENPLGTAHALLSGLPLFHDHTGRLLVLVGDNPYLTAPVLSGLLDAACTPQNPCTLLSARFPETPPPYGRIIRRTPGGEVLSIVEEQEASEEQKRIREVNASVYVFHTQTVLPFLQQIDNQNRKGEYYLTDIVGLLNRAGLPVHAAPTDDYRVSIGINNRWELSEAELWFSNQHLRALSLERGITILRPETVTIEPGAEVGEDCTIHPHVTIRAGVRVGAHSVVGPGVCLNEGSYPEGCLILPPEPVVH